jgi:preprotein translocase subunit SecY
VIASSCSWSARSGGLLIQYPEAPGGQPHVRGRHVAFLPLKLNTAGVIPPIFASSCCCCRRHCPAFSARAAATEWLTDHGAASAMASRCSWRSLRRHDHLLLLLLHRDRVQSEETADNLKKYGGFIPGIRPGERTAEYIDYVLTRITVIGAMYLTIVCVCPNSSFRLLLASRSISAARRC